MLSNFGKTWAECNFFPFLKSFFFLTISRNIHPTTLPPPLTFSRGILDQPVKSEREKSSLWRKEQKAGRMGTAEQVPLLAKMLPLPDGGRRELITFLWEELPSQIFARCFKSPALHNCPALYYSLLFSTEAPLPGQIDSLEVGRKRSHWGQGWQTFLEYDFSTLRCAKLNC